MSISDQQYQCGWSGVHSVSSCARPACSSKFCGPCGFPQAACLCFVPSLTPHPGLFFPNFNPSSQPFPHATRPDSGFCSNYSQSLPLALSWVSNLNDFLRNKPFSFNDNKSNIHPLQESWKLLENVWEQMKSYPEFCSPKRIIDELFFFLTIFKIYNVVLVSGIQHRDSVIYLFKKKIFFL